MRKLKLDVEDLAVESFATGTHADYAGTVKARGDEFGGFEEGKELEPGKEDVAVIITATCVCTATCPVVTYCASCVNTCDACTNYTCPSGAKICCA